MTPVNIEDYQNATFYGFRMNPLTSSLQIEIINDGSPVVMPDIDTDIDPNGYQQYIWSTCSLGFQWSTAQPSHLQMTIL
jgi:hypothetical protein